jgi:hypothetical protein
MAKLPKESLEGSNNNIVLLMVNMTSSAILMCNTILFLEGQVLELLISEPLLRTSHHINDEETTTISLGGLTSLSILV